MEVDKLLINQALDYLDKSAYMSKASFKMMEQYSIKMLWADKIIPITLEILNVGIFTYLLTVRNNDTTVILFGLISSIFQIGFSKFTENLDFYSEKESSRSNGNDFRKLVCEFKIIIQDIVIYPNCNFNCKKNELIKLIKRYEDLSDNVNLINNRAIKEAYKSINESKDFITDVDVIMYRYFDKKICLKIKAKLER